MVHLRNGDGIRQTDDSTGGSALHTVAATGYRHRFAPFSGPARRWSRPTDAPILATGASLIPGLAPPARRGCAAATRADREEERIE
jgi:hypothetical protein